MDVQGPRVVRPYTTKFGVSFPVAVDAADQFGQAFDLKAIPVSFLVDEVGIIRLRGGGPSSRFLKEVEQLLEEPVTSVRGFSRPLAASQTKAALEERVAGRPEDAEALLGLAQVHNGAEDYAKALSLCQQAIANDPQNAEAYFVQGLILLNWKQSDTALLAFKKARDLDPDNWRIRKQIWAIEHPDRFYKGDSPDYGWQKEELQREKKR